MTPLLFGVLLELALNDLKNLDYKRKMLKKMITFAHRLLKREIQKMMMVKIRPLNLI